jgi:hypothetical protein
MGRTNRSLGLWRLFLLMFVSLIVADSQLAAQTEDPHHLACTGPSCPKVSALLEKHDCDETLFAAGPGEGCEIGHAEEPAASVQPQIGTKNDRLFWVMPNYTTVENQDQFESLPAQIKFKLSAKTMSDPVTVSFIGAIALIGQARNSDPSYGQGLQGYSKRFGTFYADTGIGTVMTTSVFPTLLRQDPRYFQLGTGGAWRRTMYAVSRIFVARADSGELQFNYSEIVGNAVAAGISNTYHPQNQRTLGNTLNVWGTDVMLNMLCNVAKEFWPDIRRKIRNQKHAN